ncbi:MAG: thiolase family protein [Planctomycetota bacterium]|nr:MAG: thiolase family protein [Planctomycetota bacterium]
MKKREAYIVDAIRTPVGRKKGILAGFRSDQLAAECLDSLVERNKLDPHEIEDVILGCVTQVNEQGFNIARNAVLSSHLPITVGGTSVNRLCGSSQQAVAFAAQAIQSGDFDLVIGGGAESMTRVPMGSDMGPFNENLLKRFEMIPQGLSAEYVAQKWEISREEMDQFSLKSHEKAIHAIDEGYFKREILPLKQNGSWIEEDECPRRDTSLEKLRELKTVFLEEEKGGRITAGSSSQISDGAAALLLASEEKCSQLGLKPRARIVAYAISGTDPTLMLTGPIPATEKVLKKAGLRADDIDLFEVNEAFASVPIAWMRELGIPEEKVNVNGGAIALGHPLGCTGARLLTTLLYEMERRKVRYGLVTMCIGGGQGTATILERLE